MTIHGTRVWVESNHVMNALSPLKARPNFTQHNHGKPLGDLSWLHGRH